MPEIPVIAVLVAIAGVLLLSGYHKLASPNYYAGIVAEYLPGLRVLARGIAQCVGLLEVILAFALLWSKSSPYAAYLVAALFLAYLILIAKQLALGRVDMDCGCSGPAAPKQSLAPWLLWRNGLLILATLLGVLFPVEGSTTLLAWVFGVAAGSFLLVNYFVVEHLIGNSRNLRRLRT